MTREAGTPGPDLVVRARRALVDGVLRPATVVVRGGVVHEIRSDDAPGPTSGGADPARVDVPDDAVLLPGAVDSHVHVNEPGRSRWEGFWSATEAAARGGVTTIVDMPLNSVPATTTPGALRYKRAAAAHRLHVDTGFWGGAVPESLGHLERMWDLGVYGFKCFLADSGVPEFPALDRNELAAAAREIAGFGGLLLVHAEDPDVLAAAPHPPSRRFADFVASRPDAAETSAIATLIETVRDTGVRAHLLHLSSARALDMIAAARDEGLPLTVETCPHYLVLDVDHLPDGAAEFKCCPPIRDTGNQDALWDALVAGVIDCVVSDHSPSTLERKRAGGGDLQQAWGGIAGLQVGVVAVADAARRRGIGIEAVSAWTAQAPARVAGLHAKGSIAVGNDADLVVWAPDRALTVDVARLAHRNPTSAWAGRTFTGSVTRTLLRGRTVFDADLPDDAQVPPPAGLRLNRRGRDGVAWPEPGVEESRRDNLGA
ncbi:allantoinase [Sediminihabitans luteus]|uniref:allantoinase n=1 Tax=Sediminihabitans luteus TaxID=1138585 RepID=A0A2M9CYZ8_9CELL|nr:allantoinase AllB [Sediminihabitans luteus]PJJ76958.1 allantoinase [Sediminihabitans luteus]GII99599.1 allantoinase [Sediminihabitans luteus]